MICRWLRSIINNKTHIVTVRYIQMNIEGQKVLYVIDEEENIYVLYTFVTEYNVWYILETMDIAQLRLEIENL